MSLDIYTDGASRGNPGPASYAFLILKDGKEVKRDSGFLGKTTNNRAEYQAAIKALKEAEKIMKGRVELHSDSNLLVKQLQGKWKVKSERIRPLHKKTKQLTRKFDSVSFVHVPRENGKLSLVDRMCNEVLDRKT